MSEGAPIVMYVLSEIDKEGVLKHMGIIKVLKYLYM